MKNANSKLGTYGNSTNKIGSASSNSRNAQMSANTF